MADDDRMGTLTGTGKKASASVAEKTKKKTAKASTAKPASSKASSNAASQKAAPKKATTKKAAQTAAKKAANKRAKHSRVPPDLEVDPEVLELIAAIDKYKKSHNRPFPSWSEVVYVLRKLGYTKGAPKS